MKCPWTSIADCWVENVNSSSLGNQYWDSRLANKKISSGVLKFSKFKSCIIESILCHKMEAHPCCAALLEGRLGLEKVRHEVSL